MGEALISKKFIAVLVLVIAIFSWIGNFSTFSFRSHYWLEEVLHFLGGIWVAVVFLYWFGFQPNLFNIKKNFSLTLFFGVSVVVLAGVLWEFLEYAVLWRVGSILLTPEDTWLDILLDTAGGAVLILFWHFSAKKHKIVG